MKGLQERLDGRGKNGIINPANSVPAEGEQQIITPLIVDLKLRESPLVLNNEGGEIIGVADPEVGHSTVQKQSIFFRKMAIPKLSGLSGHSR